MSCICEEVKTEDVAKWMNANSIYLNRLNPESLNTLELEF